MHHLTMIILYLQQLYTAWGVIVSRGRSVDLSIDIRVKGLETGSRAPIAAVLLCRNNPCCNFYWRGWGQNTYFLMSREKNSSC